MSALAELGAERAVRPRPRRHLHTGRGANTHRQVRTPRLPRRPAQCLHTCSSMQCREQRTDAEGSAHLASSATRAHCGRAGCGGWCAGAGSTRVWRVLCAEALGTALLVALSCAPACLAPSAGATHKALAAGLVVAMLVQCLDHISGAHYNPAVTLAAALWGRVPRALALAELGAQLAGAALGAALLRLLADPSHDRLCALTLPAPGLHACAALAVEAVLGGCLALANCAAWDARNAHLRDSWPLRIGATVGALSLVAVYWAGPLAGAAAATLLYRAVWLAPAPPPPPPPPPAHLALAPDAPCRDSSK